MDDLVRLQDFGRDSLLSLVNGTPHFPTEGNFYGMGIHQIIQNFVFINVIITKYIGTV